MDTDIEGTPEVVRDGRFFVLALGDDGWGVWRRGRLDQAPLVLYPPDDAGLELASSDFARMERLERSSRRPWLDLLRWTALLTGVVWVIATSIYVVRFTTLMDQEVVGGDPYASVKWAQAAAQIAQSVFVVSLGAYLILWLRTRRR